MKLIKLLLVAMCLVQASTLSAQEVSQLSCDDFNPTPAALKRFPDLKGACEAIVERNGELYAKFTAIVRKTTNRTVTLRLPATDHTFRITPESSARVLLAGQKTRIRDLLPGQEISIYLATSEFAKPDIQEVMIISDANMLVTFPAERAPMLPKTASLLPAFGLTGLLLLAFAAVLRLQRLRHVRGSIAGAALVAVVFTAAAPGVDAQSPAKVKPARLITSLVKTAAIVEAVNRETRELKLIDASGRRFTTRVGDQVSNFNEIEPRDRIVMEYLDSIAILVVPEGTPEGAQGSAVEVAGDGMKPAFMATETMMVKATVVEINLNARRATLQYEDGSVDTINVADDVPLELVEVGDEVRFRMTHSVAVSVRRVGAM
jgi:hypothetical protein